MAATRVAVAASRVAAAVAVPARIAEHACLAPSAVHTWWSPSPHGAAPSRFLSHPVACSQPSPTQPESHSQTRKLSSSFFWHPPCVLQWTSSHGGPARLALTAMMAPTRSTVTPQHPVKSSFFHACTPPSPEPGARSTAPANHSNMFLLCGRHRALGVAEPSRHPQEYAEREHRCPQLPAALRGPALREAMGGGGGGEEVVVAVTSP